MKIPYFVIVILWLKNEICRISGSTESCCTQQDQMNQADYLDGFPKGYKTFEPDDLPQEHITAEVSPPISNTLPEELITAEISTPKPSTLPQEHIINEISTPAPKNNGCGDRVTNVYERTHDIDMRYVHDSITSMWRIIFSLVFILILLVFLISYVWSLTKKNNSSQDRPVNRNEKIPTFADSFVEKNAHQLYFPVINASRAANFLKDLDPIYDYPCSVQSDYERV